MKNITVTVNDTACRQARVWAAKRDTSVSAVVTRLLRNLPGLPVAKRPLPLENPAFPALARLFSTLF
jgi:hypothetical protein